MNSAFAEVSHSQFILKSEYYDFKWSHPRSYKWPAAHCLSYNLHVENENLHIQSSLELANDGRRESDTS